MQTPFLVVDRGILAANIERAQLMVDSASRPALQRFLQQSQPIWLDLAQKNRRSGLIRWAVDVDPLAI